MFTLDICYENVEETIPILNYFLKVSVRLRENHLSLNVERKNFTFFHKLRAVLTPDSPFVLIGNNASVRVNETKFYGSYMSSIP